MPVVDLRDFPRPVYDFLSWLSRRDFACRDEVPREFEQALAVARATEPPLVVVFDTGIRTPEIELDDLKIELPRLGVRMTRNGSAALALYELGTDDPPSSVASASGLTSTVLKAYHSYDIAAQQFGSPPTDRQAYDWLREHGPSEYKLPSFETWQRYVRKGREHYDTRKHERRTGRTGRSITSPADK